MPCPRRSAALVATATAAQIVTPGWLQGALGKASEAGAGAAAVRAAEWLVCTRKKHPLGMTLAHGIVTKGCADLLAQTIPKGSEALVLVDKLRLFRSMLASLLSTSLPFYYWTKFMHHSFGGFKRWVEAKALAPLAEKVLTTGLGAATIKTVVTQARRAAAARTAPHPAARPPLLERCARRREPVAALEPRPLTSVPGGGCAHRRSSARSTSASSSFSSPSSVETPRASCSQSSTRSSRARSSAASSSTRSQTC